MPPPPGKGKENSQQAFCSSSNHEKEKKETSAIEACTGQAAVWGGGGGGGDWVEDAWIYICQNILFACLVLLFTYTRVSSWYISTFPPPYRLSNAVLLPPARHPTTEQLLRVFGCGWIRA